MVFCGPGRRSRSRRPGVRSRWLVRQRLVVPRHQSEIDRVGSILAVFFELCPCRPKQCQMLAVMVAPRCMFRVYIGF